MGLAKGGQLQLKSGEATFSGSETDAPTAHPLLASGTLAHVLLRVGPAAGLSVLNPLAQLPPSFFKGTASST